MEERQPVPAGSAPPDPRWELIERVSASAQFRKSPKLRAFLAYLCENAFVGRFENMREQLIGSTVFGRAVDYDVTSDNIVRVEARELRKRLETYFAGEGRNESTVIEIPRGSYIPTFKTRPPAPLELVERTSGTEFSGPAPEETPAAPPRRWLVPVLAAVAIVSTTSAIWFAAESRRTRALPPTVSDSRAGAKADYSFYADLLGPLGSPAGRETLIVLSNPRLVLYYGSDSNEPIPEGAGLTVPAPPELRKEFSEALNNMDKNLPFQFLQFTRGDYTGMGEAVAAFHVGRLMQYLRRPVGLTQGRFLSWDRVQKQNLILLGAPQVNDWTFQNIAKANFNNDLHGIQNAAPLPGEEKVYVTRKDPRSAGGTALTDHAVIQMLSLPNGVNILLLAGTTSVATAGAGEFFASPDKMKPAYDRLRGASAGGGFPSKWEVLIKMNVRDGLPLETSAVAFRPARVADNRDERHK